VTRQFDVLGSSLTVPNLPPIPLTNVAPPAATQIYAPGHLKGPRLSGKFSDGKSGEVPLNEKVSLGRHPNNSLRLVDREVSKEHCIIEKVGGGFLLRDLNSSNGTFVNGRKVKELKLRDGDEIALGNSRLTFFAGEAQKGGTPTTGAGVTVVASAQSMPAFLATVAQAESAEFRPADKMSDIEMLKQDYEKLRIANDLQRHIGSERDLNVILEKILDKAFQMLRADNAVFFLPDEDGTLRVHGLKRKKEDGNSVNVPDALLRRVVETKSAVLTADAILDSRFSASESIVAQGIRSAMAVPLISAGVIRGVIFCDTRERTNAFSEKDLKVLSGIASQAAVAIENTELGQKIEREALTRAELSRFLAPAVAEAVVSGKVELLRAGELAEVSCIFADIRGFTTMAEADSPQETVNMLNTFFTAMANLIFKYEGNLDKFIGDCVMATWGPPIDHADDAARALKCALEMLDAINEMNALRIEQGKKAIEVGIGVNTGPAIVGFIGSTERHEFTAIGDSINTASRLCGLAKANEVLASEDTVKRAGKGFVVEKGGVLQVKGKEKGVPSYRVLNFE
jgi:adenylate cyclase